MCVGQWRKSQFVVPSIISVSKINGGQCLYRCNICNKSSKTRGYLERQTHSHIGEHQHNCDMCHRSFSDKVKLKVHHQIHSEELPYCCVMCNKSFRLKAYLTSHLLKHSLPQVIHLTSKLIKRMPPSFSVWYNVSTGTRNTSPCHRYHNKVVVTHLPCLCYVSSQLNN